VRPSTAATSGREPPVGASPPRHEAESGQSSRSLAANSTFPAVPRTGPGPVGTAREYAPNPDRDERTDVLFFWTTAVTQAYLISALGERALLGFPAPGGVRDGPVIR
jgi:hypothetical protein